MPLQPCWAGEEGWVSSLLLRVNWFSIVKRIRGFNPGGYWWPPTYSTWTPTIVSFSFSISLIVAQFAIFGSFSGPKLPEPFWGPKRCFFRIERSGTYEFIPNSMYLVYGCIPWMYIYNDVSCVSNRGSIPNLRPREIDVPSYPTGPIFWCFTS